MQEHYLTIQSEQTRGFLARHQHHQKGIKKEEQNASQWIYEAYMFLLLEELANSTTGNYYH